MATYNSLDVGVHYKATDLDQFVNKKDVVLLSSNENHLFFLIPNGNSKSLKALMDSLSTLQIMVKRNIDLRKRMC